MTSRLAVSPSSSFFRGLSLDSVAGDKSCLDWLVFPWLVYRSCCLMGRGGPSHPPYGDKGEVSWKTTYLAILWNMWFEWKSRIFEVWRGLGRRSGL